MCNRGYCKTRELNPKSNALAPNGKNNTTPITKTLNNFFTHISPIFIMSKLYHKNTKNNIFFQKLY